FEIDIAIQRESIFRRNRRLFVFDMDSTLIEAEVIDELAKLHGVGEQVSSITASAMRGELDFKQSFAKRVALLAGLPESRLKEVLDSIPLAAGAERLIHTLKSLGYKTAVLSGGFTFFGRHLQQRLGIDYVFANELETANGAVTGRVVGEIVDGRKKTSPSIRWLPWATEQMTYRCSTWPAWASLFTPSRWCGKAPAIPYLTLGSMLCCIWSACAIVIWMRHSFDRRLYKWQAESQPLRSSSTHHAPIRDIRSIREHGSASCPPSVRRRAARRLLASGCIGCGKSQSVGR